MNKGTDHNIRNIDNQSNAKDLDQFEDVNQMMMKVKEFAQEKLY